MSHIITQQHFKVSMHWYVAVVDEQVLSLHRRTSLYQKLPADFNEKRVAFWQHVMWTLKNNSYVLSQVESASECQCIVICNPVNTVDDIGVKSVVIKCQGYKKKCVTLMLVVLADGSQLPPYLILNLQAVPKEHLPRGTIAGQQPKGWMTSGLTKYWLLGKWYRSGEFS